MFQEYNQYFWGNSIKCNNMGIFPVLKISGMAFYDAGGFVDFKSELIGVFLIQGHRRTWLPIGDVSEAYVLEKLILKEEMEA